MNAAANILIVDDEEVVRQSYMRILASTHSKVRSAWTWEQLRQAIEDERFDLVLLDLRMPGMDGMAVLRALKQQSPESEVIIITGYPTLDSAKEALTLGAFDYLTKPVGPDHVIEAANAAVLHKRWALRRDDPPSRPAPAAPVSSGVTAGLPSNPLLLRKMS
jgi:DNA-binding NtrC family response regulator